MNKKVFLGLACIGICLLSVNAYRFLFRNTKECDVSARSRTIISLLGAPLSGKGTLAERAVAKLGFTSLSTGNLLREYVATGTPEAKELEECMKAGKLVSDDTVNKLVEKWLEAHDATTSRIILDGYPRSRQQAEMLIALLREKFPHYKLNIVSLAIPDDVLVARAVNRLFCPHCQATFTATELKEKNPLCARCNVALERRKDDAEEVVRNRLKVYAEKTGDILDCYCSRAIEIKKLDATVRPEEVFENFKKLVDTLEAKDVPEEKPAAKEAGALPENVPALA